MIEKPATKRTETSAEKAWTSAQLAVFLTHIEDHHLYPLFYSYVVTGARRGELLTLRWSDVDLARRTMTINKTRSSVSHRVVESTPKTDRGRRRLSLDPHTITVLAGWRERQRQHPIRSSGDYVFTRALDGQPHHPERVSKVFSELVGQTDLPAISRHGLRHTFASIALTQGVPLIKVSRRLGHSSIAITADIYGHLVPELDDEAAGVIASVVGG